MLRETMEEALNQCALFEGISDSDRNTLLGIAMERHLAKKFFHAVLKLLLLKHNIQIYFQ